MIERLFVLFPGRTWPVAFGSGVGLGMGYSNCQNDFRSPYLLHGQMVKVSGPYKHSMSHNTATVKHSMLPD